MTYFKPSASYALTTALLVLAAPSMAQDAYCSGLGANGQWIGGSEGASDIATSENYREQMALVLGGNQYVALFNVSTPTTVRLEAAGRGAGDPLIDVIGPDGTVLMTDDDSGGNGAARAELALDPGTYCMNLVSYDGAPMTAFVRIGRPEQEPLTEGITVAADSSSDLLPPQGTGGDCTNAAPLGTLSDTLTGEASVDSVPYWSFTLDRPTAVSISANNEDADPVLTLFDAGNNYLDENDDFNGLNAQINYENQLPAGDYCIQVDALNDTSLEIMIDVREYDPDAVLMAQYMRGDVAPPMDGSVQIEDLGVLETRLRKDAQIGTDVTWFSIEMPESGILWMEAIAGTGDGDPWAVIFDDLGRQIDLNDDYGDTLDARLVARVEAGNYLVAVKQVGGATDGLIRMVFERFVAAR